MDQGVVIIALLKERLEDRDVELVGLGQPEMLVDPFPDEWRGLRNIGGLSLLLHMAYLLLGDLHLLPQHFDGIAALGMADRLTYHSALWGVRVIHWLLDQIKAVRLPVGEE